ncbi:MAG TPA: XRE family transcriptional regulator [Ruminococcaceae bacterium]|nr:XRE family transcriptional regulator [Oscillospiraceae bacterium]
MFKNKNESEHRNNFCGKKIAELRMQMKPKCSQRQLAEKLQIINLDIDKNAIQRIECGKRFVTDIEILAFCRVFGIKPNELLDAE